MEGDDDDEDNDIDQQEPLPRLTTYKEDSYMYNCFATFKVPLNCVGVRWGI